MNTLYKQLGLLIICFLLLVSCGKVVQKSVEEEEVPVFKTTFSVATRENASTTDNAFSINEDIYAVVSGIKENKRSQLSWGKCTIEKIPVESTSPTKNILKKPLYTYSSKSFNSTGIEITGADHSWTYGIYKPASKKIKFEAKEIRRSYPRYLVTVFSTQQTYKMKFLYDETVSGNASVDLDVISDYSTFLSVLQLMIMESDSRDAFNELLPILFDETFFSYLNYTLPKNNALEFSLKNPVFFFDRSLELNLLTILDLSSVDYTEARSFLEQLKEPLLPEKAKAYLLDTLKKKQKK